MPGQQAGTARCRDRRRDSYLLTVWAPGHCYLCDVGTAVPVQGGGPVCHVNSVV